MSLKLYAPGKRKGNKTFVARGSVEGKVYEFSTRTTNTKDARRIAREFEAKVKAEAPDLASITFEEAATRYVRFRNPSKRDRSLVNNVVRELGPRSIRDVNGAVLHEMALRMYKNGAAATRNRAVLRPALTVLHHAARSGLCEWIRVQQFPEPAPRPRALTADAAQTLINAADAELRRLLIWLFYQGSRIAATLALDWSQIDLEQETVSLYNAKGNRFETFPIHQAVLDVLGEKQTGRVFSWSRSAVHRKLQALNAKTGIYFTPHMARHTLGTLMAQNRETTRAIMAALGHSTPMMSMRYQAANVEMVRAAVNRVQLPKKKNLNPGEFLGKKFIPKG